MPNNKILLAITSMFILGLNSVLIKLSIAEFPPLLFSLLRYLLVIPFIFCIPRPAISWNQLAIISLSIGGIHIAMANFSLFFGASPALLTLFLQTGPLFAILFAYLLFSTKPSLYNLLGMSMALIGILWICLDRGIETTPLATLCLLLCSLSWAIGFTLVRKWQAPALATSIWSILFTIPLFAASSLYFEGWTTIQESLLHATWIGWSGALYGSWVSMIAAGAIMMYLMRTEPAAKVAPYNMLMPVFSCLFAYLLLGHPVTSTTLIAGAWIITGVGLSQLKKRHPTPLIRLK